MQKKELHVSQIMVLLKHSAIGRFNDSSRFRGCLFCIFFSLSKMTANCNALHEKCFCCYINERRRERRLVSLLVVLHSYLLDTSVARCNRPHRACYRHCYTLLWPLKMATNRVCLFSKIAVGF